MCRGLGLFAFHCGSWRRCWCRRLVVKVLVDKHHTVVDKGLLVARLPCTTCIWSISPLDTAKHGLLRCVLVLGLVHGVMLVIHRLLVEAVRVSMLVTMVLTHLLSLVHLVELRRDISFLSLFDRTNAACSNCRRRGRCHAYL